MAAIDILKTTPPQPGFEFHEEIAGNKYTACIVDVKEFDNNRSVYGRAFDKHPPEMQLCQRKAKIVIEKSYTPASDQTAGGIICSYKIALDSLFYSADGQYLRTEEIHSFASLDKELPTDNEEKKTDIRNFKQLLSLIQAFFPKGEHEFSAALIDRLVAEYTYIAPTKNPSKS